MRLIFRLFFLLSTLTLAMNSSVSTAASNSGKNTLMVLGDSLSAAYDMQIESGWVYLLQNKLNSQGLSYKVQNESISGDTSGNGLYRMSGIIERGKFSHLVLALGANDGLRGLPFPQMQENLGSIIKMAQKQGAKVFLIGIELPNNYGSFYQKNFKAVFVALAKEYDVPLLLTSLLQDLPKIDDNFNEDRLHPNAKAQPIIMESVWAKLSKYL